MKTVLRSFVASCAAVAVCYLVWFGLYYLGMYTVPPIEEWYDGLTPEWKMYIMHAGIYISCVAALTSILVTITECCAKS